MARCLIVDDHLDGRDGFQEYLESYGMDVAAAGSAEDALRLAGQQVFDVLQRRMGLLGFLARELPAEIPTLMSELSGG